MLYPSFSSLVAHYVGPLYKHPNKYNEKPNEIVPGMRADSDRCTRLFDVTTKQRIAARIEAVRGEPVCAWCGKPISVNNGRGRKRKYCSSSCKQRAYEQRQLLAGTTVDAESVILSKARVAEIRDQLYALRCAAEDVSTAVEEGAGPGELQPLCDELVHLARQLEKLR